MMEIWHGLLLGILQGATEFLPVSSSGHLFLAETWLGLKPNLAFLVLLHASSLLAVILVYWRDVRDLLLGIFTFRQGRLSTDGRLAWQLLVATGCTVGVALLIEPYFEVLLDLRWVAGTLIITGLLIMVAEKFRPKSERVLSWPLALVLGCVQGLAVIPGISRSGLTIALLIFLGVNRQQSVRISFLLSIPTILGALVFTLKNTESDFVWSPGIILGCVVSFITAYGAILWMKQLVEQRWIWFAPYCAALGAGILIYVVAS